MHSESEFGLGSACTPYLTSPRSHAELMMSTFSGERD